MTDLDPASFDLVVINSVAQYFPSIEYLLGVLEKAVKALRPGGAIFVGDVRNQELLEAFHTSVELARAPALLGTDALKRRTMARLSAERELLIAPDFFRALAHRFPQIGDVDIQMKRGRRRNEMTRFRYDVTLRIGDRSMDGAAPVPTGGPWTLSGIRDYLRAGQEVAIFTGIQNPRLVREVRAVEWLARDQHPEACGDLRDKLSVLPEAGLDPEDVWSLDLPYDIELTWSKAHGLDRYDATFRRQGSARQVQAVGKSAGAPTDLSAYVNRRQVKVAAGSLASELKQNLQERLPSYMVPQTFVVLDALPRTPNGKIDRNALPSPGPRKQETAVIAPPQTEIERKIAGVWRQLLSLDSVGLHDNFFDLGANSFTMVQASSLLREQLNCPLSLVDLFHFPTVSALAAHLSGKPQALARELQDSQARGEARLKLRRMRAQHVAAHR